MGLGFYVGSRDGGYANHFFSDSNSRVPANEAVMNVNDIFKKGQLRNSGRSDNLDFKTYSFLERPEENICTVFPDVKFFEFSIEAGGVDSGSSTSGDNDSIRAKINCSENGGSPLFMKLFCSDGLVENGFFRKTYTHENTEFSFSGILVGFFKEWTVTSLNVEFRDGLPLDILGPSPGAMAFNYTINCKSF